MIPSPSQRNVTALSTATSHFVNVDADNGPMEIESEAGPSEATTAADIDAAARALAERWRAGTRAIWPCGRPAAGH